MSKHLLLFTIGPVQSFIAQARKAQDLYNGSFLLSHLIRTAMESAINEYAAELVFPSGPNSSSLPNRFLAIVEHDDDKLASMGQALEALVKTELKTLAASILAKLQLAKPVHFDGQINSLLQVFWLFKPVDSTNYMETYRQLEGEIGAIKNVRPFSQSSETGRKCTITGIHNVQFYRGRHKITGAVQTNRVPLKYMKDEEYIGAVAFVKRCLELCFDEGFEKNMPSTAGIALLNVVNNLRELSPGLSHLLDKDFEHHVCPQGIFELANGENLTACDESQVENTNRVYAAIKNHRIDLSPYYGIISLDGDEMGKWLSGEKLQAQAALPPFHKQLSTLLGTYADRMSELIPPEQGRWVYSGGDDVLTFVNLEYMPQVSQRLRTHFPKFNEVIIDGKPVSEEMSSASCGIAIGHYKSPLSEVLNWARNMGSYAKGCGRDRFAIAVLKRSGERVRAVFPWYDGDIAVTDSITAIRQGLSRDFSPTFIQALGREMVTLMSEDGTLAGDNFLYEEISRLVKRSCCIERNPGEAKEEFTIRRDNSINEMVENIKRLAAFGNLDNFLSALNIIRFLVREGAENDTHRAI